MQSILSLQKIKHDTNMLPTKIIGLCMTPSSAVFEYSEASCINTKYFEAQIEGYEYFKLWGWLSLYVLAGWRLWLASVSR